MVKIKGQFFLMLNCLKKSIQVFWEASALLMY